jgi:hypothetical protein
LEALYLIMVLKERFLVPDIMLSAPNAISLI